MLATIIDYHLHHHHQLPSPRPTHYPRLEGNHNTLFCSYLFLVSFFWFGTIIGSAFSHRMYHLNLKIFDHDHLVHSIRPVPIYSWTPASNHHNHLPKRNLVVVPHPLSYVSVSAMTKSRHSSTTIKYTFLGNWFIGFLFDLCFQIIFGLSPLSTRNITA